MTSGLDYQRHTKAILLTVFIIITAGMALVGKSLIDLKQIESYWMDHVSTSNAITSELASVRHHLGYGGFIHNFKNLVLRRDIQRYQPLIEQDLKSVQQDLARLHKLLHDQTSIDALLKLQSTVIEYQSKYYLALRMLSQQASSDAIDAEVKVDDEPALQALAILDNRINLQTTALIDEARQRNSRARQFMLSGGLLLLPLLVVAVGFIVSLLRRIVATTNELVSTKRDLDNLLENAPDPMLNVSSDGRIVRVNQMAASFFRQSAAALLGQQLTTLVPADMSHQQPQSYKSYIRWLTAKQNRGERIISTTVVDNESRNVEITLAQTATQNDTLTTLTLRDVTEQLQMRAALIAAKELAEQNLQRQKMMQEELVQAEKMAALGKLVAGVAHEINTPVGVMLTAASHLHNESGKVAQQLQQEKLGARQLKSYLNTTIESSELICSCCNRAAELIQSFKQVAVDQTAAVRRTFDMACYLNEVIQSLKPSFKKRPIALNIDCADGITLDSYPGTVAQVLTNLLLNSLTHAFAEDESGSINISINRLEQPADWLEWVYEDDGAGIAAEHHTNAFEPFFTTNRQHGSTGLGLHIVYSCVTQILQGSIVMSSTPQQGTCFIIRIPLQVKHTASTPFST
jgi:PAS domain S-box-containing protein